MRCAVFLLLATSICVPQEPGELNIKVQVNLMQVDVTVLDKSGRQVEGLTAADFQVFRDGKLQAIKNVLYVSRPLVAPTDLPAQSNSTAPPALLTASLPTRQLQAKEVRRTIAVMIDDLSINPGNLHSVWEALRLFVQEQIQPGDLVAVYLSSGGLGLFGQFTTDKRAILASIDRMRYRSMNGVDSLAPISSNPQEDDPDPTIAQMAVEARLQEEVMMAKRQDILTAGMLSTAGFIVRGLQELPGLLSEKSPTRSMPTTPTLQRRSPGRARIRNLPPSFAPAGKKSTPPSKPRTRPPARRSRAWRSRPPTSPAPSPSICSARAGPASSPTPPPPIARCIWIKGWSALTPAR